MAVGQRRRRRKEREGSEGGMVKLGEAAEGERKEGWRPSRGGEGWRGRVGSGRGRWRWGVGDGWSWETAWRR